MPWWLWGLLGLGALVGESVSMALFLLNVGIAALVAAILAYLGAPVAAQIAVFAVLAILLIGVARPRMLQMLVGRAPHGSLTTQDALLDRIATVTEPISVDTGMIRIGKAEFWTARANTPLERIEAGSHVRIVRIDGLTAYVDPFAEGTPPLLPGPTAPRELAGGSRQPAEPAEKTPETIPPAGIHISLAADAADVKKTANTADDQPATFGELLKRCRIAANLTQEALAERAGLSVRAISDLERGLHRTPQRDTVHLLAVALDLSPEDRAALEATARRGRDPAAPSSR